MIGGQAGRHLRTLGNSAMAGDHNIHFPGGLVELVERRVISAHLIGLLTVEERDQDVGEHVAGKQDAAVCEQNCRVADSVCRMLDDLARRGSAVSG